MIASSEQREPRPRTTAAAADVLGVVLCGGKSRRMGVDKAIVELGGRTLLAHAIEPVATVASRIVLASGGARRYAALGYDVVLDRVADGGPLAGLEAALHAAGASGFKWVVAVACDMPGLEARVLDKLLGEARDRGADACLLRSGAGLEPLYAVYHVRCHGAVRAALDAGERRMISFHDALEVVELTIEGASARNLNTLQDLEAESEVSR